MIEKGTILRCRTKTKDNTFGVVLWEVLETGLPAPEAHRNGQMDGLKVVMLGGSGPSARAGLTLIDSEDHIQNDIREGVTAIVPAENKDVLLAQVQQKKATPMPRHGGTGVVEL